MEIEVKTALEGCARYCPRFHVVAQILFNNDGVYNRVYKCGHLDECEAMLEAMHTHTVDMKNIT